MGSAKRWLKIAAAWVASNMLWSIAAPGLAVAFSAVITAVVDIAEPWRILMFIGLLMGGTGVLLGVVRPLVERHLPEPVTPPPPSVLPAPTVDPEAVERDRALARALHEVRDEIAANLDLISEAKGSMFWLRSQRSLGFEAWLENRALLGSERALAATYRAAADTYVAFKKVERAVDKHYDEHLRFNNLGEAMAQRIHHQADDILEDAQARSNRAIDALESELNG